MNSPAKQLVEFDPLNPKHEEKLFETARIGNSTESNTFSIKISMERFHGIEVSEQEAFEARLVAIRAEEERRTAEQAAWKREH